MHINKAEDTEHVSWVFEISRPWTKFESFQMIPRTQRHINPSPCTDFTEFHKLLLPKLNEIKRKQEMEEVGL